MSTPGRHAGITPDGLRRVSNSEIQAFKECRRKWWLVWYRGLRKVRDGLVEKRHTGDRVHRALQLWYVPAGTPRVHPSEAIERVITEDRIAFAERLRSQGWTEDIDAHPEYAKLVKANDLERIMVSGYMEWLAETGEDAHLEIVSAEEFLEAPLPEMHDDALRVVGKIDVRALNAVSRTKVFVDHKTKDVYPKTAELRRDEQMMHYELLEELSDPGPDGHCEGALYNVLRRVKRSGTAKPPFYGREFIPHNTHTRAAFRRRLVSVLRDMISVESALDDGAHHLDVAYPTPSKDCDWKCPFASVCTMFDDGSYIEFYLAEHYRQDDPLHYYGVVEGSTTGQETTGDTSGNFPRSTP